MALTDSLDNDKSYYAQSTSEKDIALLSAKCTEEGLTGVSYINPALSDYKFTLSDSDKRYTFIKYTTAILDGLWGSKKASYADLYKSSSSNTTKLSDVAAWGCAPIPSRWGLGNTSSKYISTHLREFSKEYFEVLTWEQDYDDNNRWKIFISNEVAEGASIYTTVAGSKKVLTAASCIIVDLSARGGDGGDAYAKKAVIDYTRGGGGGGSGAWASVLIDMSKAKKIIIDNRTAETLKCYLSQKGSNGSYSNSLFLSLNRGQKGSVNENGSSQDAKGSLYGGLGGTVGTASSSIQNGIKILWTSSGSRGGYSSGANGNGGNISSAFTGSRGHAGPGLITFITGVCTSRNYGGIGGLGIYDANNVDARLCAGGGGAGSILYSADSSGGKGIGDGNFSQAGRTASAGCGGGGGYAYLSEKVSIWADEADAIITGRNGLGGNAGARFHFEKELCLAYTQSQKATGKDGDTEDDVLPEQPSSGGGSIGGGCVFPGNKLFITKDEAIDISEFVPGTTVDFCNPATLEHFSQQTLAQLFSRQATRKITIWLEDGKSVELTPDHVILTEEGFKIYLENRDFPKYDLRDKLATVDGYKKIVSIQEDYVDPTTVYNIVTENSLMTVNGIIMAGEVELNIETTVINDSIIEKALPID